MPDFFDNVVEHLVSTIVAARLEMNNGYHPYQPIKAGEWAEWLSLPAGVIERIVFIDHEGDDIYIRPRDLKVDAGDTYRVQAPTADSILSA